MTGENRLSEGDRRGSEARTQGLYQVTGQLGLNLGYARRMTDEPMRTEKLALGIAYEPAPRWKLLAEHSYLIQHDTKTSLSGAMVALSRELLENVWLTFGYSYADYVGFEGYGDEFARQRSGLFIEFDVAFFEWPFVEWLAHSKSDE